MAVRPVVPEMTDPVLEPWRWRQEEALNGLGVLCMDEAADGTLWFGNTGSIASYDGIHVTKIPFDEDLLSKITHEKSEPWAKALIVLNDGNLLVLAGESLLLRANGEWTVIIKDAGPSVWTARMEQAKDGTVWLMVPGALWRIGSDLLQSSVVLAPEDQNQLLSFCIDPSEDLWVIEKTGALTSRLIHIPVSQGRPAPRLKWCEFPVPFDNDKSEAVIAPDENGLIWYASKGGSGVEAFDSRKSQWLQRDPETKQHRCYSILNSHDGVIWAAGEGTLLRVSSLTTDVLYDTEDIQLPLMPLSLTETESGRFWVIGRIGSVYSVDVGSREWKTYKGLNYQCESSGGLQWFTTTMHRHVVSYNPETGEWLQYSPEDGLIDSTLIVVRTSHGLIWAAGSHNGRAAFSVFDGVKWERVCHSELLRRFEPNAVFEAADGTVWLGSGGGLSPDIPHSGGAVQYQVNEDRTVQLRARHIPPDFPYYVTALTQTADQVLWVGSTEVFRYDGLSSKARRMPELQGTTSVAMAVDSHQTVWVAKDCYGVCLLQNNSWRVFGVDDGLPSLNLIDLIHLRDGTMLLASDKGISRFDGKTWIAYAYPQWFRMLRRRSGLKQSGDGSIWLNYISNESQFLHISSETKGFCTVRHRPETDPPETWITDYLKRVSQPGNSHILWAGHDVWSVTPVKELQYSWRLDGGEWSAFSHETGRTFLNLSSGRHTLEVRARDRAFNVDPTPACGEFIVIPPVWRQSWFLTMVFVLVGLILFLTWLLIRNRERHLLERQADREILLKRQQEDRERHLLEMDRLKTGFFTNISHELRTPLTVILGPLEMMMRTESDPKKRTVLSMMVRNAQRVATLITQLLDFRKLEEGKIRIEATYGDLVPVVNEVVTSLQPLAESARISCSLESVAECRGWFDVDKLQKIFTNLIANAIKYTAAGGSVQINLQTEDDISGCPAVRFTVEDSGVGIAKEHVEHVFERFYRVSETSMAVGAGIGLNLTKELVELLGGEIHVESPIHPDTERPGTRFTVRLPIKQAASGKGQMAGDKGQVAESVEGSPPLSPLRPSGEDAPLILLVEDDEDIRTFIADGLESSYRVETAGNGELGLRMAKEEVPDLIVTDVMMPVMDGVTLCRELKTSIETSHIPVVMLTAKAAVESQIEGLKTGADDYITKPFHMEFLQVRIANLLESRRLLREKFCREHAVLSPELPENSSESEFLKKAADVLEANYSEWNFNPEVFAGEMNMTVRTLQRKLKAVMDRSPSEWINDFRMRKAAELLAGTSDTVSEIMFRTGYDHPPNFNRLFRKYYQASPSEYRAAHRSSPGNDTATS